MVSLCKSTHAYFFIVSLFVFFLTAIFSEGYYHPDEHFQILEYANYKLGNVPASELPWEFKEKIRPALQPAIAYVFFKFLKFSGIHNPFTYALLLRIITALIAWFVICKTSLLLTKDFTSETGKKIFLFLALLLWFIPSISVRFSSENYSGLSFLAAIYFNLRSNHAISKKKFANLFFTGVLLGLSFFFRFQIGFALLGLGLWMIFIKKEYWKNLFILLIGGASSIIFCLYIDYWFYGEVVLTPINYFFSNIIENKAADWGISPWWYYFKLFILQAIPPFSIFLSVFFFIGLYKKPLSIFAWCLVPFLIAHFAVGHKEMRFLFPMLIPFIYLTTIGIDSFIVNHRYKKALRFLFVFSVIINTPVLLLKMLTPAQEVIPYYKFLYNYSLNKPIELVCIEKDAYEILDLKINFYKSPRVKSIVLKDQQDFLNYLDIHKPDSLLLLERTLINDQTITGYKQQRIYTVFPEWILKHNYNNWVGRSRIWSIKKLRRIE
jgi:phosphatidylinositol glycan class B